MAERMAWLFLREKPTLALLAVGELEPAYAALVAKKIDSTFPHTSNILSQMEEGGLIRARPVGRIRYLELTEHGKRVFLGLKSLTDALVAPSVRWRKMERLKEIAGSHPESISVLRLGPLRRELSKLRSSSDEELIKAAEDLDEIILKAIRRQGSSPAPKEFG